MDFVVDDVLNSKLSDEQFDFIFDRGIFHVFDISQRPQYVKQIKRILKKNGFLFLKCMSAEETNIPDNDMPHKLSESEIREHFEGDFEIQKIKNSIFSGTLELELKALFVVLKKK
ncbi:MAG: class I SAM-dependent methyltransferase [Nitrosopumilus sp.]|nr:class I SAM-dependent methyltransferase [Nitrosopumilus sp.]